jgi:outer membrane protein TolC
LLNLPRETKHKYVLKSFSTEGYQSRSSRFNKYLSTADQLETFRDFFDEQAQNNSPDLKVLIDTFSQAKVNKERFQSKFYPTLSLDAGYFNQVQDETQSLSLTNRQAFEDRFGEGWNAQVVLKFPLFLGGSRFKEVEKANIRILEIDSQIQSRKNTVSEQARSGLFDVFRSQRNLDFSLRNVLSSKENLNLAEVAYLEGDLPIIDLLDSQTRLITSQTNAVVNRYQFHRDLFSLFRNVGRVDLIKGFNDKEKLGIFINQVELYFKERLSKHAKN